MSYYKRQVTVSTDSEFKRKSGDIIDLGNKLYSRGLLNATSGNISSVLNNDPLELAITASGVDKGNMNAEDIIIIDSDGTVTEGNGKPSAETLLHLAVIKNTEAKSVIHTHSIWSTVLSRIYLPEGFLSLKGYEMLKALDGNKTHEANEVIPVFENTQDMKGLSEIVSKYLKEHPETHGFVLSGHGLYTWGKSLKEAKRSVEALEFLLEVKGRELSLSEIKIQG